MKYKIVYENEDFVKLTQGCVDFIISKKSGTLLMLRNNKSKAVDVKIPHLFPSGHIIYKIEQPNAIFKSYFGDAASNLFKGKFGTVTIENGIDIGESAFYELDADEVVWPDSCLCIPNNCFASSSVTKITNIDKVRTVDNNAFANSKIEVIKWPSSCKIIPEHCFYGSSLTNIYNLENVEVIGGCAFQRTKLSCLDLSSSNITHIEPPMFFGIPSNCKIIPHYYVPEEEIRESIPYENSTLSAE